MCIRDSDISGGVLLAAGSAGMAVAPQTTSTQGWLSATVDSGLAAGTVVHVVDADGAVVATFTTSKPTQNIVFSSPEVTAGEQYRLFSGGTASGASVGGLAAAGDLGSAVVVVTVTAGEAPAGRGPGQRGGGQPPTR